MKLLFGVLFIFIFTAIVASVTYTPGDPYTDVGSWLPTVVALFGSAAAYYGAHKVGWLDFLD